MAASLAAATAATLTITHVLLHGEPPEAFEQMARVEHLVPSVEEVARPFISTVPVTLASIMSDARYTEAHELVMGALGEKLVNDAKTKAEDIGVRDVRTQIRNGDYAGQILEAAMNASADMIVVGSRGLSAMKRLMIGSVSHKVMELAPCTVVVAR